MVFIQAVRELFAAIADVGLRVAQILIYVLNPLALDLDVKRRKPSADSLLESRLEELAQAMQRSSLLVVEVEAALTARRTAVEKLRLEAETAQQLQNLTLEQREAVATVLRAEVTREGKKVLWQGALVNAVFFGLGILVSMLLR